MTSLVISITRTCPHLPQQAAVFVEVKALRRNTGRLQFVQVLLAQSFIRRNQQNVVQRFPVVVEKLAVVQVQQQRLAGCPVAIQNASLDRSAATNGRVCSLALRFALRCWTNSFNERSKAAGRLQ